MGSIRLACDRGPNIRFTGWQPFQREGRSNPEGRWLKLALYGVEGGGWVAEMAWCSTREGEIDLVRAREVATVADVMEAWDWTVFAKQAAKELQWDVTMRLGSAA